MCQKLKAASPFVKILWHVAWAAILQRVTRLTRLGSVVRNFGLITGKDGLIIGWMDIKLEHRTFSMTVLADWQIRSYCESSQMVHPFALDLLNPASLDVRLGFNLMIEVADTDELQRVDISHRTADNPYFLQPGEFCLAETIETFNLPDTVSCQFVLKSSRARSGLNHLLAGWCDPGWHGSKLTLELKNERRFHEIPLYPNLKIGQMVFHYMSEIPVRSYREVGHYNNHLTVMPNIVDRQTA